MFSNWNLASLIALRTSLKWTDLVVQSFLCLHIVYDYCQATQDSYSEFCNMICMKKNVVIKRENWLNIFWKLFLLFFLCLCWRCAITGVILALITLQAYWAVKSFQGTCSFDWFLCVYCSFKLPESFTVHCSFALPAGALIQLVRV